ncbi:MAG: hypothetical protein DWI12_05260 [Planctomycetota bacterium]|jgi:hypothetical protein|nr:MAG: hypothetical protein DWI12_05260 [Planctomycetota bacterium]
MTEQRMTLHTAYPTSLADEGVAAVVHASALEAAERHGVTSLNVVMHDDRVELIAPLPPAVLLALATHLRRTTGRWHQAKFGVALWRGE